MSVPKAPAGHFTVLYFAAAASYTQRQYDFFTAPIGSRKLFELLEERYTNITARVLSSCAITINLNYIIVGEEAIDAVSSMVIQAGD